MPSCCAGCDGAGRESAPVSNSGGSPMSDSESVQRSGQGEVATAGWERSVIERFARQVLVERRRARRWSIFFRLLLLFVLAGTVGGVGGWWGWTQGAVSAGRHTALIEIKGVIEHDGAV